MHAKAISTRLATNTDCSEKVAVARLNLHTSGNIAQITQSSRESKATKLTDQEALHNSIVAVKNMPRPGALLNLDPRSMFLGWTELPREAHEDGYWCISFVNRETHRIKAGRSARTWQGASNTSINRLLRSLESATLRSKASSPRDMLNLCRGICRVFAC